MIDTAAIRNLVGAVLNATRNAGTLAYGNFAGDDFDAQFSQGEIDEAIKQACRQIVGVIFDTKGHYLRQNFLDLKSVASGEQVKDPIGAFMINGLPGVKVTPSRLRRAKENFAATVTAPSSGYYTIEGHLIHYVGTGGQIEILKDPTDADIDANFPLQYGYAAAVGALAIVFPKQGTNVEAASHFGGLFARMLEMIRQGATDIPAPTVTGQEA